MDFRTRSNLNDMLRYAAQARAALGDRTSADLESDADRASAVLWPLTLVGEAASQLPAEYREAHQEVAFRSARLTRNRLVHGYHSIRLDIVRLAVLDDLPLLIADIERLLAEEPE